jgi:glycosyltransferase involved in cell wall biosynthesis
MKTRIVFCITELDPGGAERALTQLVTNLDRNEWDIAVVCLSGRGHFSEVIETAGIPVHYLNARSFLDLPRLFVRLFFTLRKLRPAIVQTFLFHANLMGRICARLAGVKVVVSGLRVAEHRNRWHGRLDRWTNRLVDCNVCVSQGVADFAEKSMGLRRNKLFVIPNAVEGDRFAKVVPADLKPLGIPENCRVMISIGRLERQKGFDLLIDAVTKLSKIPEDLRFLIVGDGPDAANLKLLVRNKRLDQHVCFAGRREDVPQLLAASNVFILPSRWEGMPNVVLEAMAAGLCVITTDVEGIPELIQDGVNGIVVPVESAARLAKAIEFVLANTGFAREAGAKSQQLVREQFTIDKITREYDQHYRRFLAPSGTSNQPTGNSIHS